MSLSSFFNKSEVGKKTTIEKSMEWMVDRSQAISQNIIKESSSKTEGSGRWGHMYQFVYDAKTKSKLKYYDYFPLSIVLERYSNGFLGFPVNGRILRVKTLRRLSSAMRKGYVFQRFLSGSS